MAKIKVGDRVRFLNMTGGGIVKKVLQNSNMLYVEDESGFEIPVRMNEVVQVEEGATIVPKSSLDRTPPVAPTPEPEQPAHSLLEETLRKRSSDPQGEEINAFLCYLVEEGGKLAQAAYEVYLVNESNYDLLILYTSGRGAAQETRYAGIVPFDSIELLESFMPEELMERGRTTIEIIPFKEEGIPYRPKRAMTIELRIDAGKFFKQNAFVAIPFFDDLAICYPLILQDQPRNYSKVNSEELREEMLSQKREPAPPTAPKMMPPKRGKDEPEVIDLHAEELLDSTIGLAPKDILEYQLKKVREVMDRYQRPRFKGKAVIFIHGKGEGVLRSEVLKIIHREYPKCETQDASFQEYGFGASKVIIH